MQSIPACVGIILDGNRRYARARGLPTLEGHRAGLENIGTCARYVRDASIQHLVLYVLSTENLKRTQEEVSYLMSLAVEAAEKKLAELGKENMRVRFIGKLELLPPKVRDATLKVEHDTKNNTGMTLWICLAYGSHAEIVDAARAAMQAGEITEESLRSYMWSAEMPDPDLIIRPGGEKRLSNFLLWQAAYSELFFLDVLWPEFTKKDFDAVLNEYLTRDRRKGR